MPEERSPQARTTTRPPPARLTGTGRCAASGAGPAAGNDRKLQAAPRVRWCAFGEAGRHARAAVGVASLPMNAAVEVEAVYPIARIKEAVAHAARGGRSGKILVSFEP